MDERQTGATREWTGVDPRAHVQLHRYLWHQTKRTVLAGFLASGSTFSGIPTSAMLSERDRVLPPVTWWRQDAQRGVVELETWANDRSL